MKILHIMGNDKFASDYIKLINTNFKEGHVFLLLEFSNNQYNFEYNNVILIRKSIYDLGKLYLYAMKSDKIIFHGMFSRLVMSIICFGGFSKKTYCALWGGDLYNFKKENYLQYLIKKHIISNSRGIIMELEEDYYLAQKWYNARCPFFQCMLYLSNIVEDDASIKPKKDNAELVIQVGNSADPSNEHMEILRKLEKFENTNIKLVLPLSYGDKKYAAEIEKYAINKFKDKVLVLRKFLPLNEYLIILDSIDVAIFAHRRQQALGNTLSLLAKGKKVYVRGDVTVYNALTKKGIVLFKTEKVADTLFERLPKEILDRNRKIVLQIASKSKLIEDWKKVFQD